MKEKKKTIIIVLIVVIIVMLAFLLGLFVESGKNNKDMKKVEVVEKKVINSNGDNNNQKMEIEKFANDYPQKSDSNLIFNDYLSSLIENIDSHTNFQNIEGKFSNGLKYNISCTDYGEMPDGGFNCYKAVIEIPSFRKEIDFVAWQTGCIGGVRLIIYENYLVVHYESGCGDPGYMYIIEKDGKRLDNGPTWNADVNDTLYPYMYKFLVPRYISKSKKTFDGIQVLNGKLHFLTHSMIDLSKVSYYVYDFKNDKFDYKGYIVADAYSSQS